MTIKALWRINTGEHVYEPGDTIAGLSPEQEQSLIIKGAAELVEETVRRELVVLKTVLGTMKKDDLLEYAKRVSVEVSSRMKVDEIKDVLLEDAKKNGVDIDALTDEQLAIFADELGAEVNEKTSRDDLIEVIEKHFKVVENA